MVAHRICHGPIVTLDRRRGPARWRGGSRSSWCKQRMMRTVVIDDHRECLPRLGHPDAPGVTERIDPTIETRLERVQSATDLRLQRGEPTLRQAVGVARLRGAERGYVLVTAWQDR